MMDSLGEVVVGLHYCCGKLLVVFICSATGRTAGDTCYDIEIL